MQVRSDDTQANEPSRIRRLLHVAGLDRAVAFTAIGRVGNSLAGLAAVVVVARCLSLREQGYYTTFSNLLAMQVFFELGLGTVILHAASHEVAHLELDGKGRFTGNDQSRLRLADLLKIGTAAYALMAALFVVIIVPIGILFFQKDPFNGAVNWHAPWILTVGLTGAFLPLSGATSFIEGTGLVTDAARIRLIQGFLANLTLLIILLLGFRLFATAAGAAIQALAALSWLVMRHRHKIADLWRMHGTRGAIDWKRQIWPFQWRMALSWMSGYLIFQLFTPILFQVRGPEEAGRFGLTFAVINGITAVCTSWITTKVPRFGSLIAIKNYVELDRVFLHAAKFVVGLTALLAFGFWATIECLRFAHVALATRFADGFTIAMLSLTAVNINFSFSMASYLRSHKKEPYLWSSLGLGAVNTVMAFSVAKPFGSQGVALGAFLSSLFIASGLGYWIFQRKRTEWHGVQA